ncbi:Retrovirus-related Pol polyprotein from transposon TNT 1-94 [Ceratocystis lukuohia]|uniref:Retrovirus-related Pol polyprotein from transposon TNT 1-94 n=1 Tax=Ceratocystis lukuohia TaxID=2019550 RepID=A0ABR4MG18_9PEZI
MTVILEGRNWKEWESNFLMQIQNEGLQYLLAENPMEGVEREKRDSNKKQKDEELAKRILEISLNETFRSLVRDEETLSKAYKKLKKACPADTTDEAFYEMGRVFQSPLVKGMTILQSWMNFETVYARHYKAENVVEKAVLKTFLILLPLEYQEVAKECYRKKNISTDEVIQCLEAAKKTYGTNGQAKYNRSKSKCFNCGKEGHSKTECWSKKKTNTKQKANQATEEKPGSKCTQCQNWIIDSGCSCHMTKELTLLQNPKETRQTVKVANGDCIGASKVGLVDLNVGNKKLKLSKVLYVPKLSENLISVKALMKEGKSVLFKDMNVTIDDGKDKMVIPLREDDTVTSMCFIAYDELHRRFGHISDKRLRAINPEKTPPRPEDFGCEHCSKGKMTRSHGNSSVSMATEEPLDSVSIDVSGPHEAGRNGHRWYAIIVDNFSRYKWLLPLRKKSDVQRALDEWRKVIELKMGKTIKRTRSDNAPELKQILESWRRANGTEPTYTLTDSSSQNGIAERAIRTVNDGVRTMLSETKLGERFWVEAARTTVYISNRTLSTQGVPHSLFFGIEPQTDHIRRWGCQAIRHSKASKHGPRGSESLLLGYDENVDGRYILWDIQARKVRVTESVHFYENMQPKNPEQEKELPRDKDEDASKESQGVDQRFVEKEEPAENYQPNSEVEIPECQGQDQGGEEQPLKPFSETKAITGIDTTQLDAVNARLNLLIESLNRKIPKRKLSEESEIRENQPSSQRMKTDGGNDLGQKAMLALSEPSMTLDQAILHPMEGQEWKMAIKNELDTLEKFGTWRFVPEPKGCDPIDTRFVFAKKYGIDGKLEKYKARLVVRGFRQEYGVNFFESFAPTPGSATLRLFLAAVCQYDMECHQIDACNAFAQSKIKEDVYIKLPANVKCPNGMVAKLDRCLYGLKQAAYQWNEDCTKFLRSMGFENMVTEPCLLYHAERKMLVLLYVDDITIASLDGKSIKWFKDRFSRRFVVKDLGETTQIIGIQVSRDRSKKRLWINQKQYIQRMVDDAGFDERRRSPIRTPVGD